MIQPSNGLLALWASRAKPVFNEVRQRMFGPLPVSMWFCASVIAALAGPFGTFGSNSTFVLLLEWMVLIALNMVAAYACFAVLWIVLGRVTGALFHGLFFTMVSLIGGAVIRFVGNKPAGGIDRDLMSYLTLCLYMFVVLVVIFVARSVLLGSYTSIELEDAPKADEAPAKPAPQCRLAQRLGLDEGAHIRRISASGHHIDVYTCTEVFRTRMRFSDAILELDGLEGLITHRSHWVALDAIVGWVPSSSKPYVVLPNDETIPVSKTYRSDVEAAGLTVIETAELV